MFSSLIHWPSIDIFKTPRSVPDLIIFCTCIWRIQVHFRTDSKQSPQYLLQSEVSTLTFDSNGSGAAINLTTAQVYPRVLLYLVYY